QVIKNQPWELVDLVLQYKNHQLETYEKGKPFFDHLSRGHFFRDAQNLFAAIDKEKERVKNFDNLKHKNTLLAWLKSLEEKHKKGTGSVLYKKALETERYLRDLLEQTKL